MLWQICVVLLIVYALLLRWKNRDIRKIAKQLPIKLKPVPFLGHAVHLLGNGEDRMKTFQQMGREAVEDYNGLTSIWLAHRLIAVVADPEAAEVVLKACLEKDDMMNVAKQLIGNGSIFAPVPIWRLRRKLVTPLFGQKTLNSYVTIFSNNASILMDQLQCVAGKGNISIFDYASKYTMDIVSESALGININSLTSSSHPAPKAFDKFCSLAADRLVKPWLYLDSVYRWNWNYPLYEKSSRILKEFVAEVVKLKRQEIIEHSEQGNNKPNDNQEDTATKSFLELLIESGGEKGSTDLELQEEALVLLLAATHSSAITFSFASLMLARHPDIQEKVFQEIKEVIGDSKTNIEGNDLLKLKYLEAVIKETLRLYPPIPLIVRKIDKNITLPSGLTLVPGVGVTIHIWATHRNPKYWGPDANIFRPERWLEGPLKHPYAFLTFSNGPRNCIGYQYALMSLKTAMAHFIKRFRILTATATNYLTNSDEELRLTFETMLKHVDNFEVQLELRI